MKRQELLLLMDQLQSWLGQVYTEGSIPICSVTFTQTTEEIAVYNITIWDSENGFDNPHLDDQGLSFTTIIEAWKTQLAILEIHNDDA
jgi:hypothetical protein